MNCRHEGKYMMRIKNALIKMACLASVVVAACATGVNAENGRAYVNKDGVYVDGKQMRLLCGEVHYFRIMPQYWKDSLEKLRACGLNTVSTYCPWNAHEPAEGKFDFDGILNLRKFLQTAQDLGLKVMLRPGPYICSEWDTGGLPWWLGIKPDIRLRTRDPQFMAAVEKYMDRILEEAKPYFCNNGGPIIAIQIENGYASFGNDVQYIADIADMVKKSGFEGILYTSDGDSDTRIHSKNPKGIWKTLMTGTKLAENIKLIRKAQPDLPAMISEYWVGQGLRLGVKMRTRDYESMAKELDEILADGAHVCCYMFHGGTNFGLYNGALKDVPGAREYIPFASSYDVDAVLTEAGDTTPKYDAFRKVFLKYNPEASKYKVPANSTKKAYGKINFTKAAPLSANIKNLSKKTLNLPYTVSMDSIGQPFGLIHYSTRMQKQSFPLPVTLRDMRDRAWVSLNGKKLAVFTPKDKDQTLTLDIPENGARLDILVENMGRVNFGLRIGDNQKGLLGGLVLNKTQQFQNNWQIDSLPLDNLEKINWQDKLDGIDYPAFFSGSLNVEKPQHTYIKVDGVRGYLWINGFLVGRYESTGPITTTYVPAALLKKGENKIEILELEKLNSASAESLDKPILLRRGKK